MSKFQVTARELNSAISTLTADNAEFKRRVAELQELQQELAAEWKGDANTAFNQAFQADKGQWDAFANLVDNYVATLQSILQQYENAEATNLSTAQNRRY